MAWNGLWSMHTAGIRSCRFVRNCVSWVCRCAKLLRKRDPLAHVRCARNMNRAQTRSGRAWYYLTPSGRRRRASNDVFRVWARRSACGAYSSPWYSPCFIIYASTARGTMWRMGWPLRTRCWMTWLAISSSGMSRMMTRLRTPGSAASSASQSSSTSCRLSATSRALSTSHCASCQVGRSRQAVHAHQEVDVRAGADLLLEQPHHVGRVVRARAGRRRCG